MIYMVLTKTVICLISLVLLGHCSVKDDKVPLQVLNITVKIYDSALVQFSHKQTFSSVDCIYNVLLDHIYSKLSSLLLLYITIYCTSLSLF